MCKIMMIAGLKKEKQKQAWQFIGTIAPLLSKLDNDGMGYAAFSNTGQLFGERWLNNKDAFKKRISVSNEARSIVNDFNGILSADVDIYDSFGSLTPEISCIALHARMATCDVTMSNVHPFVHEDTALIHNGVIQNHYALTKKSSTCDSETILHEYLEAGVRYNIDQIQVVSDILSGYFACAVLTKDKDGTPIMDIFKDQTARLCAVWVPALESLVYCTEASFVRAACKKLKWQVGTVFTFEDCAIVRVNALTGKPIETAWFSPESGISVTKLERAFDVDPDRRYSEVFKRDPLPKAASTSQYHQYSDGYYTKGDE